MRKVGSRSDQRPGTPSCGVQLTGSMPRIGWRSSVAARAPKSSSRISSAASVTRLLIHTWSAASSCRRLNTLMLYALAVIASKCSNSASHGSPSNTRWRTS